MHVKIGKYMTQKFSCQSTLDVAQIDYTVGQNVCLSVLWVKN
jgi:hypothetical protein